MKKLFYIFVIITTAFLPISAQIIQDTSSFFPRGLWGIWIDQAKPPFTRGLNSFEWDRETANWATIDANYLIAWIPVWLEDTVMTITEPLGYKMDLTRSDFSVNGVTDTSLRKWIQSAPNPLSTYWKQRTDQKILGIKAEFGSRQGFYSYFLAHEADLRGSYNRDNGLGQDTLKWTAIRYAINKIKELDPEHKSYIVHNVRYQFGAFPFGITLNQFADLFPNLDIFQMDDYVFEDGGAVAYNYQQQRLDILLGTYNKCMNAFKDKHTEWHAIIQSQSDKNDLGPILRRPRLEELKVQAYLALSRGAKGVTAFVYGSSEELPSSPQPPYAGLNYLLEGAAAASSDRYYNGIVDNDRIPFDEISDPEHVPAFVNLNSVFQEIAVIGSAIRKLRIYDAFPNSSIPSNNSAGIYSVSGDKIEIGTFKRVDEGSDSTNYFMVVNRVCNDVNGNVSSPQSVVVTFGINSIYSNWKITQVGSTNSWTIYKSDAFTVSLDPGEGQII